MKRWKWSAVLAALVALAVMLVGCNSGTGNSAQPAKKEEQNPEQAAFPVTVKDGLGEEVTIKAEPQKIVSLIPSNTEIAYALGLGEKIVGVSDFDNYPDDVKTKTKVGSMEFNVEKIISLKPDLVLAHASSAHNAKDGLQQLKDAGITVLVINSATSFNDVYASIKLIGQATGTADKAEQVIHDMKAKLAQMKEKAKQIPADKQVNVWVEVEPPPQLYTAGKGTFMDEMLQVISARNVAGDLEGWPMVTEEQAVAYKPDVIITTYSGAEQVLKRTAWKDVPAVKNKRVYDVNTDLVSRPGPRLVEGVEELAKAIYPDVFK
ncbi:ABC transporter substrate-binding protein [Geobacillus sp. 47C-IIb]|uniref:ABC transporter substrate-binding protein n=1 Tax=unclassified Geobacillus TaxID=2642459 RepID=UPI0006E55598|nr:MULTISPECIES: ABC transporter substrate-binding protein [unclassified Geobacillus]KQB92762.1 putative ABC transporter substrate-binding lipoprotein YvrC [Geobacillus sp. PA-3]OQP10866.1 ABC transporter substrate-binding protein [Geobacillus sp. 47C-IIb]QNU31817.1 ABC transporter substrate-binding protein [Geobacillus sp. 47C-IIb]